MPSIILHLTAQGYVEIQRVCSQLSPEQEAVEICQHGPVCYLHSWKRRADQIKQLSVLS